MVDRGGRDRKPFVVAHGAFVELPPRPGGPVASGLAALLHWGKSRDGGRMKKLLKVLGGLVALLVVAVVGLFAYGWVKTEHDLSAKYTVADPPLTVLADDATLARGAHLFTVMGCGECHGDGGVGKLIFDAPPGRFAAPNITPAALRDRYTDDQLAAAIRHGVKPDGTPLRFMPAGDFHGLSDTDTAALIAHVRALAPSGNDPGRLEVRPLGRVLAATGMLHLVPAADLDHSPRPRVAPPAGPTPEYGKYLAQACTGCHGADFAGQHVPGTPPEFPDAANLTPAGIGGWTDAQFEHALRHGKRPDGRPLSEFMPWKAYASFSDEEVAAIHAFLKTVPAKTPRAN
jgi:cytochrome c553